ncbi:hypothetical protein EVAR_76611_1 [Eumeta japonica]|uniref:Uncharacterized protein n=1 Tax=Eumeta variegata TaxID=151549 RepID=A0A4C1T8L1_EUMVA|nr:hypothetical protein EVAR_76611_1 [Eumeta japonica]
MASAIAIAELQNEIEFCPALELRDNTWLSCKSDDRTQLCDTVTASRVSRLATSSWAARGFVRDRQLLQRGVSGARVDTAGAGDAAARAALGCRNTACRVYVRRCVCLYLNTIIMQAAHILYIYLVHTAGFLSKAVGSMCDNANASSAICTVNITGGDDGWAARARPARRPTARIFTVLPLLTATQHLFQPLR